MAIETKTLKNALLAKSGGRRRLLATETDVARGASLGRNDLLPALRIDLRERGEIKLPARRLRREDREHVARVAASIRTFGFTVPVLIHGDELIDGHIRLEAAAALGLERIPCVNLAHLSEDEAREARITVNRLAEKGGWNIVELRLELIDLQALDFDLEVTGFTKPELDQIMLEDGEAETEEVFPPVEEKVVTVPGQLWVMDQHRLLCGDSLLASNYALVLDRREAAAVFTDLPYNVKIAGNVSGLGKVKHGEFAAASGEMSREEFQAFLITAHQHCFDHLVQGGAMFSCMDWRSIDLLYAAGHAAGFNVANLIVWDKGSGGMGGLYRSAHELIALFAKGKKLATNNVQLGRHGRDRTNVWAYPGANRRGTDANAALAHHPTPKNLDMVADALLDVTKRGALVLDPFLGSGTTLIAAEKTGRVCAGIELEAKFVDLAVRRWQAFTGRQAVDAVSGETFDAAAAREAQRRGEASADTAS